MDPIFASAALGLGQGLGRSIAGGSGGPFSGGSAQGGAYGTTLDGSGWIVNMGGTQTATSTPTRTTSDSPAGFGNAPPSISAGLPAWLPLAIAAAGVAVLVLRRKRRG